MSKETNAKEGSIEVVAHDIAIIVNNLGVTLLQGGQQVSIKWQSLQSMEHVINAAMTLHSNLYYVNMPKPVDAK